MTASMAMIDLQQLLSDRLGEPTNWLVLTGPPSAGKTTVLTELAARGYKTSPDVSREHLQSLIVRGSTRHEARGDPAALQYSILAKMLHVESHLQSTESIFLDYALPDNLPFWEIANLELSSEVWKAAVRFRYRHVFVFEPLPFVQDDIRVEAHDDPKPLWQLQTSYYRSLGYAWTGVPAAPVADRIELILGTLRLLQSNG